MQGSQPHKFGIIRIGIFSPLEPQNDERYWIIKTNIHKETQTSYRPSTLAQHTFSQRHIYRDQKTQKITHTQKVTHRRQLLTLLWALLKSKKKSMFTMSLPSKQKFPSFKPSTVQINRLRNEYLLVGFSDLAHINFTVLIK